MHDGKMLPHVHSHWSHAHLPSPPLVLLSIGLWPVVESRFALKSSKYRKAGTKITVPVEMTKERNKEMVLNKLLPAIRERWKGQFAAHCGYA
ncbi:hypothetical protein PybrP1_010674 [[Pythium] brassicae (nom. inval.)]|nr:hypothetical protein PybrP1_010674 [[Pythium] brassicae (nom. inval.)]